MSLELFERTPSSSQGENKEHDQEPRGENIPFEGESGFEKCFDMPMVTNITQANHGPIFHYGQSP